MTPVSIEQSQHGFILLAEGKPLVTPLHRNIILPTGGLAEALAAEWRAQGKTPRKETMPFTRIACIALDLASDRRAEASADILSYCDTDTICYRAGDVPELLARQSALLDPVAAWAQQRFGIDPAITHGVMPAAQRPDSRMKITAAVAAYDIWRFAVFASLVKPLSSIILSLAVMEKHLDAERAFYLSQLEEAHETGIWGKDAEKEAKTQSLKQDVLAAERFLEML
jgi:chaperone required for assembly of F1-ATPase